MMRKHGAWLWMVALAIVCMGWHFGFGWSAFQNDAQAHQEPAVFSAYLTEYGRDTFENLQSEFWQLAVQFLVLAGVLKALKLQAYEDDQEEMKKKLDTLSAQVRDVELITTQSRDSVLLRCGKD